MVAMLGLNGGLEEQIKRVREVSELEWIYHVRQEGTAVK